FHVRASLSRLGRRCGLDLHRFQIHLQDLEFLLRQFRQGGRCTHFLCLENWNRLGHFDGGVTGLVIRVCALLALCVDLLDLQLLCCGRGLGWVGLHGAFPGDGRVLHRLGCCLGRRPGGTTCSHSGCRRATVWLVELPHRPVLD